MESVEVVAAQLVSEAISEAQELLSSCEVTLEKTRPDPDQGHDTQITYELSSPMDYEGADLNNLKANQVHR